MPMPTTSPGFTRSRSRCSRVSSQISGSPNDWSVAAASTYNHRGVMTAVPKEVSLGLTMCMLMLPLEGQLSVAVELGQSLAGGPGSQAMRTCGGGPLLAAALGTLRDQRDTDNPILIEGIVPGHSVEHLAIRAPNGRADDIPRCRDHAQILAVGSEHLDAGG